MLSNAFLHADEIKASLIRAASQERCKFYFVGDQHCFVPETETGDWSAIRFVSLKDGLLHGMFIAFIGRPERNVGSLMCIRFTDGPSLEFARDFKRFIIHLMRERRFYKMNWSVIVGNPAERMYDRFIANHGGRVVGTYRRDVVLCDGEFYDRKAYELFSEEFHE